MCCDSKAWMAALSECFTASTSRISGSAAGRFMANRAERIITLRNFKRLLGIIIVITSFEIVWRLTIHKTSEKKRNVSQAQTVTNILTIRPSVGYGNSTLSQLGPHGDRLDRQQEIPLSSRCRAYTIGEEFEFLDITGPQSCRAREPPMNNRTYEVFPGKAGAYRICGTVCGCKLNR